MGWPERLGQESLVGLPRADATDNHLGADFFIAETFNHLGEAKIALDVIKQVGKPAMVTFAAKNEESYDNKSDERADHEAEDQRKLVLIAAQPLHPSFDHRFAGSLAGDFIQIITIISTTITGVHSQFACSVRRNFSRSFLAYLAYASACVDSI